MAKKNIRAQREEGEVRGEGDIGGLPEGGPMEDSSGSVVEDSSGQGIVPDQPETEKVPAPPRETEREYIARLKYEINNMRVQHSHMKLTSEMSEFRLNQYRSDLEFASLQMEVRKRIEKDKIKNDGTGALKVVKK